jgi:hypothetical protein
MRAQYTEQLLSRAERDPEFRKRLSEDANSAVQDELGVELPQDFQVRVLEEGPNEAILVLPRVTEPGQLRDEELVGAAGGSGASWCGATQCNVTCTYPDS